MKKMVAVLLICTLGILVVSCASDEDSSLGASARASAGNDQFVQAGGRVLLVGNAINPDTNELVDIAEYNWAQTSGDVVSLSVVAPNIVEFESPSVTRETVLRFQVTITDVNGATAADSMLVTVFPTPAAPDEAEAIEFEPNNVIAQSDKLVLAKTIAGQLANNLDEDFFSFDATADTNYLIQFVGSSDNILTDGKWEVQVIDAGSIVLSSIKLNSKSDSVVSTRFVVHIESIGEYYVRVNGTAQELFAVTVSTFLLPFNVESELNDSRLTANNLILTDTITGQISSVTDKDYYAFTATANTGFKVDFTGDPASGGASIGHWRISILDASSNVLASLDVDDKADSIAFDDLNVGIEIADTYNIVVEGVAVFGDVPTQPYTLTVNFISFPIILN